MIYYQETMELDAATIESYRHAKCHELAYFLHLKTGLPLAIMHGPDNHPCLAHVGLMVNNSFFDINGLDSFNNTYDFYHSYYATDQRSPPYYLWTLTQDLTVLEEFVTIGGRTIPETPDQDLELISAQLIKKIAQLVN